jgi:DNA-binding CsgD family transcriptional regulator
MPLTSADETDLILPLFDVMAEQPPFGTFLDRLRRRTRAHYVNISVRVGQEVTEYFLGPDMRSRAHALGEQEFNLLDKLHYDRLRPGRVYSADEFVQDDPALKSRRAAHMAALGIADQRVVRVLDEDGASAWLIMARTTPCTAADSALLSNLAPYVERTLRTLLVLDRQRLASGLSIDGLDRSGAGWIAFDRDARVIAAAEGTSETLARAGISLRMGARAGGLGARIDAALADSATSFARDRRAPARTALLHDEPRIEALLVPAAATPTAVLSVPVMIAHLRWPRPPSAARAAQLAELFGLGRREAELAINLADGLSLAEAGAALGLTIETTRNYSKRLYAKLGVRGQAEVVRLVSDSAAALA